MIAYVTIGTNDLNRAREFYDSVMASMGGKPLMEDGARVGYGRDLRSPIVMVGTPFDGQPASVGNGTMVGLSCGTPEVVDAVHAAALANGGQDEGAPGLRRDTFYIGYFRDLDGNKLAAFSYPTRDGDKS